jgi:hypothetical protein
MREKGQPADGRHGGRPLYQARGLCDGCYRKVTLAGRLHEYPSEYTLSRERLLADVEHLASTGLSPREWAADLDTTPAALARRLYRYGREDLARPVEKQRQRDYQAELRARN